MGQALTSRPGKGPRRGQPRGEAKRARIVEGAIRHFARRGFRAMRVDDLARELGISKASVFQHFESKEGLFYACFIKALSTIPTWLEVPEEWLKQGFFGVVRYWLDRPVNLSDDEWINFQVGLMGVYSTELDLKNRITRYIATHDPYGTQKFVRWGIERGDVRDDLPSDMIASLLNWMMEHYEDALLSQRLTPNLFRMRAGHPPRPQEKIEEFLILLRGAIGARERAARKPR